MNLMQPPLKIKTYRMEMNRIPFTAFLPAAFDRGDYSTDDSIAFVKPLFREVLSFHEAGQVGPFEREDALFLTAGVLDIDETKAHPPVQALYRFLALSPRDQSRTSHLLYTIKLLAKPA